MEILYRILYSLIIAVLLGFVIRSLFIVIKDMEIRKKRIMNGIIMLFIFLVIYISLLTYSPLKDPLENFGGIIGAYIAKSILKAFGITAYLLPLILIIGAIALLCNRTKQVFYHFGGLYIWLFFITLLIQSILPILDEGKRGDVGVFIGNFLLNKLTMSGSIALISFIFLIVLYIYLNSIFKLRAGLFKRMLYWMGKRRIKSKILKIGEERKFEEKEKREKKEVSRVLRLKQEETKTRRTTSES